MKIIDRKSFFPTVCVVYTIITVSKIVIEAMFNHLFGNYQQNILMILFLSFLATFVLSQHYRLQAIPLPLVILLQYVALASSILLVLKVMSYFTPIHPDGYRDMLLSFTIPYVIGAVIYYISLWQEVQKVNLMLNQIKKGNNNESEKKGI